MAAALGTWMNFLPPSRARVVDNLRLLAEDWRAFDAQGRYFIASQLLSLLLTALCALGAVAAIVTENAAAWGGLIVASAFCLAHSLGTWAVLKRRFLVRYQLL